MLNLKCVLINSVQIKCLNILESLGYSSLILQLTLENTSASHVFFLTSPSELIRTHTMVSLLGTHLVPFMTRSLGGLCV